MKDQIRDDLFDPEQIILRVMTEGEISEMRDLHDEWFPIKYPAEYFKRLLLPHVITIGAFYTIESEITDPDMGTSIEKVDVLIGCVMSRIKAYGGHAKRVIKLSCQKSGKVPASAKE